MGCVIECRGDAATGQRNGFQRNAEEEEVEETREFQYLSGKIAIEVGFPLLTERAHKLSHLVQMHDFHR